MVKRRRRRVPRNAIVLSDIIFKLGVEEVVGVVQGQQGIDCFVSKEAHIALPLPFNVPLSAYGEEFTAYIRSYDKSLVLELGEDEVLSHEIRTGRGELDVTNPDIIANLFEEQKMREVPQALSGIGSKLGSLIVAVITTVCKLPVFPFVVVPACIALFGINWSTRMYLQLSRSVVYDAVGNWIDLKTGRTSLNNGEFRYKIEVDSDDCDEFEVQNRRRRQRN